MTNSSIHTIIESPLGEIVLTSNAVAITGVYIPANSGYAQARKSVYDKTPFEEATRQLKEYFAGKRTLFDLPLALEGTVFQKRVWDALRRIPYGKTSTYAEIAVMLGNPQASRAVGSANGKNPVCIIVPCHRVICSNGGLGGYNGGIPVKEWLLNHEKG